MPSVGGISSNLTPTAIQSGATYTASSGQLVLVNAATNNVTVTLPPATVGALVGVKRLDSGSNSVTVVGATGSVSIDSDTTGLTLVGLGSGATLSGDGSNWQIASTTVVNAGSDSLQNMLVPTYTVNTWYDRRSCLPLNSISSSTNAGTIGTATIAASSTTYVPLYAHRTLTIDTYGIVAGSTAPTSGATIQVGLYTNTTTNTPGTRLYTFGTLTLTASANSVNTGAATAVIPKGWSWIGLACNATSPGSVYAVAGGAVPMPYVGGIAGTTLTASLATSNQIIQWYYESGSGTLNATATPLAGGVTATTPNVFFRVSAVA